MKKQQRLTAYGRDIRRTIRHERRRFLAIMLITLLGVMMFSGLRASCVDLRKSADAFFDRQNLHDLTVMSTLGLTKEDVSALAGLDGISKAEGIYSEERNAALKSRSDSGSQAVTVTMKTLAESGIDAPYLQEGSLPSAADEASATEKFMRDYHAEIGDTITLPEDENAGDSADNRSSEKEDSAGFSADDSVGRASFAVKTFTITGVVTDSTDVDNPFGSVSYRTDSSASDTIFIPKDAVKTEYYTAVVMTIDGASDLFCYSDSYEERVKAVRGTIENTIRDDRETARSEEIREEARKRLDEATSDAQEQLDDAKAKLEDGEQELLDKQTDAEREIADGEQELKDELAKAAALLEDAQEQLDASLAGAAAKLNAAQKTLDSNKAALQEKKQQLSEAEQQLAEAQEQLDTSRETLSDRESAARKQLADGISRLDSAISQIDSGIAEVEEGEAAMDPGFSAVTESSAAIDDALSNVNRDIRSTESEIEKQKGSGQDSGQTESGSSDGADDSDEKGNSEAGSSGSASFIFGQEAADDASRLAELNTYLNELNAQKEALESQRTELDSQKAGLEAQKNKLEAQKSSLERQKGELTAQKDALLSRQASAEESFAAAEQKLAESQDTITENKKQVEDGKAQLAEAEKQLASGRKSIEEGWEEYQSGKESGQAKIDEGRAEYESGKAEGERKIADARQELAEGLADGRKELDDGWSEYNDAIAELNDKIADAQQEIDDLDTATWYIQDRSSLSGYSNIGSDADSIEAIGTVFPIVFFIVAILISLTAITRMVDEDRPLIGTYKSLGYTDHEIRRKYLVYAFAASLGGSVLGTFCAFVVLPEFIFTIFSIMYLLPSYALSFVPFSGILGPVIFIAGILAASWIALNAQLSLTPASLMRPKTPRAGSRIFLERITPVWRRMSFLNKVTARNLFRYKKRMLMTIFGIAGCMALLLFGFAIKDSVNDLRPRQYEETIQYDLLAAASADDNEKLVSYISGDADSYVNGLIDSAKIQYGDAEISATLIVVPDGTDFSNYVTLADASGESSPAGSSSAAGMQEAPENSGRGTGSLNLSSGDVYVTLNAGNVLGFGSGDEVTVQLSDLQSADTKVTALVKNYLGNYIYMNESTWESLYDDYAPNGVLVKLGDGVSDQAAYCTELGKKEGVISSVSTGELADQFAGAFQLINAVVYIVIGMSAALAFVVLFTLSTTNISEREREIATIKVLGFFDREVHLYIDKETVILTLIGIVFGIPLGWAFAQTLTSILNLPSIYLAVSLHAVSYLYAAALTLLFMIAVNFIMDRVLNRVNPAEALKSVE